MEFRNEYKLEPSSYGRTVTTERKTIELGKQDHRMILEVNNDLESKLILNVWMRIIIRIS